MPGARIEYRDLVIPLCLRLEGSRYPTRRELAEFHGDEGVVLQHLAIAAREGWQADEAAGWDSRAVAGRFLTEDDSAAGGSAEVVTVYQSVTIRLRRFAGACAGAAGAPTL